MVKMVWVIGCVLLASGCVGSAADKEGGDNGSIPDAAGPAQFSDTTGAVEGLVLDEEQNPIPGAQVGLLATSGANASLSTISDVGGHYSLSNVPPGSYQAQAAQLGFNSATRTITVETGQVASVSFTLAKIPTRVGYHDVWMKKGYFQCSNRIGGSTGPCGFTPAGNITQVAALFNQQGSRAFIYQVGPGVVSAFNEMQWTPGSAATGTKMSLTFSYQNRTSGHWYCNNPGSNSPLFLHWDRAVDEDNQPDFDPDTEGTCHDGSFQDGDNEFMTIPPEGQELRSFANTGPARNPVDGSDINNFGMAYEQGFEIWFSFFYWELAPEGYSALADG